MQRFFQKSSLTIFLVTLLLAQGCVNLKPRENDMRFYVLGANSSEEPVVSNNEAQGLSIGLRRLQLAEYLDSPRIVVRKGSNEVQFSENHRWGEDLGSAINRVVASFLVMQPSVHHVDVVPWTPGIQHDYVVEIQVVQFEGIVESSPPVSRKDASKKMNVHLTAHWHIVDPTTNAILRQGTTDESVGDWSTNLYPNLVSGLEQALEKLSKDLVVAVDAL